jgi:hypothetical protein
MLVIPYDGASIIEAARTDDEPGCLHLTVNGPCLPRTPACVRSVSPTRHSPAARRASPAQ